MKKLNLSTKIILSMIVGMIVGLLFNSQVHILPQSLYKPLETYILGPIGTMFINAIKMLVVPMVFVSLVNGVAQMGDVKKLGRVGGKTIGMYLITTALAITIGISLALLINPGANSTLGTAGLTFKVNKAVPVMDMIIGMVPTNPIQAMAEGNMLQVIVFSLLLGVAILSIPNEKSKIILSLFDALNDAIIKIIDYIMMCAPLGVFCLITKVLATLGLGSLLNLGLYMMTILLALAVHLICVYTLFLYGFTKLNPLTFYKKFWPVMCIAFSTSSSNATLPVNMEVVEKDFGVKKSILGFTLPLGATVNMDGTAIMQGVATIFIAQLFNTNLTFTQILTVILTATLASLVLQEFQELV